MLPFLVGPKPSLCCRTCTLISSINHDTYQPSIYESTSSVGIKRRISKEHRGPEIDLLRPRRPRSLKPATQTCRRVFVHQSALHLQAHFTGVKETKQATGTSLIWKFGRFDGSRLLVGQFGLGVRHSRTCFSRGRIFIFL